MTEAELIAGCIRQDRQLQRTFFERYRDGMFTVCYRLTGNREMAEDALLEGFMEVFRDLSAVRKPEALPGWMKTIMVRKALAHQQRERQFPEAAPVEMEKLIVWPSQWDGAAIDQAIRNLPDGFRAVFTLIEVEGYSHREVGELLGISEGTSKSQLYHAKRRLRAQLEHHV